MKLVSVSTATLKKYRAQMIKATLTGFVIIGLLMFWLNQEKPSPPSDKLSEAAPLYDLTKAVEDKSFWLFQAQNQLREQAQTQEKLLQEIEELKKLNTVNELERLKTRMEELEQAANIQSSPSLEVPTEKTEAYFKIPQASDNAISLEQPDLAAGLTSSSIFSESLALSQDEQSKLPHRNSFIPPGTYTKAVLLSGVDVGAGVSSQTSPKPVLLRLIDKGSLPNQAFGKMKDCRIIAAAYGDLSSERAYMRLEKLSCVQPDGHVIVTEVDGYVNGEDGKNGLRGRVVIRDAEVLARGFMGGLLSGLGKASSQSHHTTSLSPFGAISSSQAKGLELFKQSGAQGLGDAFELMAKYNIQRAEQYQPIIQISAGREVDVVFHSGSQFGEKKTRKPPQTLQNNFPAHSAEED